jgi:hypothetical protein
MIRPTPGDEDIYIEQILHGKSARYRRTESVVSGGSPASGAKIMAPVLEQWMSGCVLFFEERLSARRRRYSETVSFACRALARIDRASSWETLKLNVSMRITVIPSGGPVKAESCSSSHPWSILRIFADTLYFVALHPFVSAKPKRIVSLKRDF